MTTRPRRFRWTVLSLMALAACGGGTSAPNPPPPPPPPPPPAPVTTVDVTPPTAAPLVGQTVQLTATPKTAAGTTVTGKTITWSSSAEPVASVSAAGLVTALTPGQTTISASADGVSGTAIVTVTPAQAAACTNCLEVVPATLLLPAAGAQQQLAVFSVDATGRRASVTATFESSNPSVVTVSASGRATAAAALGSSYLTVRAGSLTSAPVLALVAQPAPGALLVSDAQVEGVITPVNPAAPYQPGYQYRVRLRGAAPAVGQVVLGTGNSPVGGRVVSVTDAGPGLKDVVLELLPLTGMFAALSVNQQVSMTGAPALTPAAVQQAFVVEPQPGGSLRFTPRSGQTRMVPTNVRSVPMASALNNISFDLGPYSCEAKVEGALSFPAILNAFSFTLNPNLTLDLVITNGQIQRLVAHGDITPTVSSDLLLNAAVKGSVECKVELRTLILPIGGPIALIIGGQVPLGVGFALEAKVELAGIGYDAFFQSTVTAAFGLDCAGGCHVVHDLTHTAGGFFKPRLPASFNNLRTELAASLFGFAQLQIGNPFLNQLQFKAVEIKAGLQQKAELASEQGQADDPAYASSFTLAPMIEAKTTSDVAALAGLLNIQFAELSFVPTLPTLAQSPVGTFTITPATVQAGTTSQLGDMATFTISLNPVTYLGIYAVEGVEIRWLKDNGTGTMVLQPGRPGCTSLTPSASGQTVFTCQTDFLVADAGTQKFYAFVKAKLFGIPVPLPLEIAGNAAATVSVQGPSSAQVTFAAGLSVDEDPLCTDRRSQQTGTSASISVQITCQKSGTTWQVLASNSSTLASGALTGSISRSGAPTGFTAASASGSVVVTDPRVVIDAPGLTGTQGTFSATMEITGSLSATGSCVGNESGSASARLSGGAFPLGGGAGQVLFGGTDSEVGTCGGPRGQPLPTVRTGPLVSFTFGAPFSLFYSIQALAVNRAQTTSSSSAQSSITYRWLGMTGLAPGATVSSASGVDWSRAAP